MLRIQSSANTLHPLVFSSTLYNKSGSHSMNRACRTGSKIGAKQKMIDRTNNRWKKSVTSPSKSSNDDYYLRWNATGDYNSDDDNWWNAVERKDHRSRRNKKKSMKKKTVASTAIEETKTNEKGALYLRYKYHTKRVLEWGNSSWTDLYDTKNCKDGSRDSHLSLRAVIWRLNDLASHEISMPKIIIRNLEQAIELREEFQKRFVNARREKAQVLKGNRSPISSPLRERNDNDFSSCGQTDAVAPKKKDHKVLIEDHKTTVISKDAKHQYILDQLKALLVQFRTIRDSKILCSDDKAGGLCNLKRPSKDDVPASTVMPSCTSFSSSLTSISSPTNSISFSSITSMRESDKVSEADSSNAWETLLDEYQDEENGEMLIEETRSLGTNTTQEKFSTIDAVTPEMIPKRALYQRGEEDNTENRHPNKLGRRECSSRVLAKQTKQPYTMLGNIDCDSVWDIFGEEKTKFGSIVLQSGAATTPALTVMQNVQPEDDWEDLYS